MWPSISDQKNKKVEKEIHEREIDEKIKRLKEKNKRLEEKHKMIEEEKRKAAIEKRLPESKPKYFQQQSDRFTNKRQNHSNHRHNDSYQHKFVDKPSAYRSCKNYKAEPNQISMRQADTSWYRNKDKTHINYFDNYSPNHYHSHKGEKGFWAQKNTDRKLGSSKRWSSHKYGEHDDRTSTRSNYHHRNHLEFKSSKENFSQRNKNFHERQPTKNNDKFELPWRRQVKEERCEQLSDNKLTNDQTSNESCNEKKTDCIKKFILFFKLSIFYFFLNLNL